MKKKTMRIVVVVLAVVMALSVLAPAVTVLAGAVTQSEINDIKNDLNDIANQKEEMEEKLDSIRDDVSQAKQQIELVQGQIILTEAEIAESQSLLNQYDTQIAEKEGEIAQLEEQEAAQYEEFYAQTRWMEETGSASYISILFQASSFSQLLDYFMLITDIMDYSDKIIKDLEATQAQLAQVKEELQISRDEQAQVQASLEGKKAELETRKAEANTLYSQLSAQESEYAAKAQQLADDEAEIQRELDQAEELYQKQLEDLQQQQNQNNGNNSGSNSGGSNVVNSGGWHWPLPGRYYISSVFGGRYSPINGNWESHTGADIPAPGGTPIQSAKAGVVTTAKYNVSYGNYCIVSHGNGYATLYAHMSSLAVSAGQTVSAGQVLGYVGSTGDSTGNHLHFELRINGSRYDALDLYPNLNFTGVV